jgi:Zn-dependent peptidase ImmA (M78 family)
MRARWYSGAANVADLGRDEMRRLRLFGVLCDHFARLERLVQGEVAFELPTHVTDDPAVLSGSALEQGARLAGLERERLRLGEDPLEDVEAIMDAMGMKVLAVPMPAGSDVAGGFFFNSEVGPCIMVNARLEADERAFSIAHQYGHFLADFNPYTPRVCMRGEPEREEPSEERATGFAEAFMLPGGSLDLLMNGYRAMGTGPREVKALSIHYGVPVWVVAHRLRGIGFDVSDVQEDAESAPATEDAPADPHLPERLVRLALEARLRGLISPLRMARLLRMEYSTAERLYSYYSEADQGDVGARSTRRQGEGS